MTDTPSYEKPTIAKGGENPRSWEHSDIKNAFDPLVVDDAVAQAEKYWQMRQAWEEGIETFVRSVTNSLAEAWSGPAAEQSRQAIENYINTQARPLTPALESLCTGVQNAADAIVNTKHSIPDDFDNAISREYSRHFNEDEFLRRTEEAWTAMSTNYVKPFGELDAAVPVLPVPTGATTETPVIPPGDDGTNGDNGDHGDNGRSGGNGITGGQDGQGGEPGESGEQPAGSTEGQTPGQSTGESAGAQTSPTGTGSGATGTDPFGSTSTSPESTTAAGATGGSSSGSGYSGTSGGGGGAGGSSGGSEGQSPGRTVQGSPGGTATGIATGVAGTVGTGSSARGMSGMPMGGAGARGNNQGDQDSSRKTPDYLISQENTDELLGETPPTITGGVIGMNPE